MNCSVGVVFIQALMLYKLYYEKKVKSLDDPFTKYMPKFSIKDPFNSYEIVLRWVQQYLITLQHYFQVVKNCS